MSIEITMHCSHLKQKHICDVMMLDCKIELKSHISILKSNS